MIFRKGSGLTIRPIYRQLTDSLSCKRLMFITIRTIISKIMIVHRMQLYFFKHKHFLKTKIPRTDKLIFLYVQSLGKSEMRLQMAVLVVIEPISIWFLCRRATDDPEIRLPLSRNSSRILSAIGRPSPSTLT